MNPKTKGCECPSCGRPLPNGTPECPYCGENIPGGIRQGFAAVVFLVLLAVCGGLDFAVSGSALPAVLTTLRGLLTYGAALPVLLFSLGTLLVFLPTSAKTPGMPQGVTFFSVAGELLWRILYLLLVICAATFIGGDVPDRGILYRVCGVLALAGALLARNRFRLGRNLLLAAPLLLAAVWLT